jgi:hypothetical protein
MSKYSEKKKGGKKYNYHPTQQEHSQKKQHRVPQKGVDQHL